MAFSPAHADALLDRLEREVPSFPTLFRLPAKPFHEAIVFGDSHGDFRSTGRVAAKFLAAPDSSILIGLGDYLDRAPNDCPSGSVVNALYLLGLAAAYPDRVVLIKGNHELDRIIGVRPHDLPEEIEALWGDGDHRYLRLRALLERGPLAAVSPSGVYLAHGGFPRRELGSTWEGWFEPVDDDLVLDVAWGECGVSRTHRRVVMAFDDAQLTKFLKASGTRLFLRGHDPDLVGQWVYGGRCLTLHTSRTYASYGGVLTATVPLDRAIDSSEEIRVDRLPTK